MENVYKTKKSVKWSDRPVSGSFRQSISVVIVTQFDCQAEDGIDSKIVVTLEAGAKYFRGRKRNAQKTFYIFRKQESERRLTVYFLLDFR